MIYLTLILSGGFERHVVRSLDHAQSVIDTRTNVLGFRVQQRAGKKPVGKDKDERGYRRRE